MTAEPLTDPNTIPAGGTKVRPRILYVDHTAIISGGEIALLNLLKTIDRTLYEPIVVLFTDGPLATELRQIGIETHILELDPAIANTRKDSLGVSTLSRVKDVWKAMKFVRRLRQFMIAQRVDLVHANSLKADLLGGIAARLAGKKVIWHVRDRIADDYLPPMVARVFRLAGRMIPHHIIANSAATLRTMGLAEEDDASDVVYSGLSTTTGQTNSATRVIHDGLDITRFSNDSTDNQDRTPVVGLLGRISPWKGQDVFVRAAAMVLKDLPHVQFRIIGKVMFGEEEFEKKLHALIDELGVGGQVRCLGFRSDVMTVLSELTLLVHASTSGEPFGQVIVEGMAAGLPVVATNGGGVPEIVVEGETGLLVPMGDAPAMADAIRRMLTQPTLAWKMGEAGRLRVESKFTIKQTASKVEHIYRTLLRK